MLCSTNMLRLLPFWPVSVYDSSISLFLHFDPEGGSSEFLHEPVIFTPSIHYDTRKLLHWKALFFLCFFSLCLFVFTLLCLLYLHIFPILVSDFFGPPTVAALKQFKWHLVWTNRVMKVTAFNFLNIKRRLLFGCSLSKQIYIKTVPVLSFHLKGTKNLTRITLFIVLS